MFFYFELLSQAFVGKAMDKKLSVSPDGSQLSRQYPVTKFICHGNHRGEWLIFH